MIRQRTTKVMSRGIMGIIETKEHQIRKSKNYEHFLEKVKKKIFFFKKSPKKYLQQDMIRSS